MLQGRGDEREALGAEVGDPGQVRRRTVGQGGRVALVEAGEAEGVHDPGGVGLAAEFGESSREGVLVGVQAGFVLADYGPGSLRAYPELTADLAEGKARLAEFQGVSGLFRDFHLLPLADC